MLWSGRSAQFFACCIISLILRAILSDQRPDVFVSATSAALGSSRQSIKEALLTLGCVPVEQTTVTSHPITAPCARCSGKTLPAQMAAALEVALQKQQSQGQARRSSGEPASPVVDLAATFRETAQPFGLSADKARQVVDQWITEVRASSKDKSELARAEFLAQNFCEMAREKLENHFQNLEYKTTWPADWEQEREELEDEVKKRCGETH